MSPCLYFYHHILLNNNSSNGWQGKSSLFSNWSVRTSFLSQPQNQCLFFIIGLWSSAKVAPSFSPMVNWLLGTFDHHLTLCFYQPRWKANNDGSKLSKCSGVYQSICCSYVDTFSWSSWRVLMHCLWFLKPLSSFVRQSSSPSSSISSAASSWGLFLFVLDTVYWNTTKQPAFFNSSTWASIEISLFLLCWA